MHSLAVTLGFTGHWRPILAVSDLIAYATNAILRFDPMTEKFESFPSTRDSANVRQMAGRRGEAWGAESGTDRLVVIRYGRPPQ